MINDGEKRSCQETMQRLYDFLDGELTDSKRQAIKEHLDTCSPCLDAFGFEEELRHMLATKCRDKVPDVFLHRISLALSSEQFKNNFTSSDGSTMIDNKDGIDNSE